MAEAQTPTANSDNVINVIVGKIAELEDVRPTELTPPIYEAVDPDVLYRLLSTRPTAGRMEGQLAFSYNGHEVTVGGDGSVSVEE